MLFIIFVMLLLMSAAGFIWSFIGEESVHWATRIVTGFVFLLSATKVFHTTNMWSL